MATQSPWQRLRSQLLAAAFVLVAIGGWVNWHQFVGLLYGESRYAGKYANEWKAERETWQPIGRYGEDHTHRVIWVRRRAPSDELPESMGISRPPKTFPPPLSGDADATVVVAELLQDAE